MRISVPDYMFSSLTEITPEFLKSRGIKALLCDIDNTLVTYDDPTPTPTAQAWIDGMTENGIKIAFVSNNDSERVLLFNRDLGFMAYPNAKKPLPKTPRVALSALGVKPSEAAMLGDQIFTDVWTGRLLGIRTLLVPPIKDKTSFFFKSKRFLEKPFISLYKHYGPLEKKKGKV